MTHVVVAQDLADITDRRRRNPPSKKIFGEFVFGEDDGLRAQELGQGTQIGQTVGVGPKSVVVVELNVIPRRIANNSELV